MTINTINYGEVPFVKHTDVVPPYDECIDWLEYDEVEIWRLASGRLVAIDCHDDCPNEDYDIEMGFDPYMGCYSDDC